ncbi:MAG: hypothetical protein WB566_05705 [Terriglobales bacterium]
MKTEMTTTRMFACILGFITAFGCLLAWAVYRFPSGRTSYYIIIFGAIMLRKAIAEVIRKRRRARYRHTSAAGAVTPPKATPPEEQLRGKSAGEQVRYILFGELPGGRNKEGQ